MRGMKGFTPADSIRVQFQGLKTFKDKFSFLEDNGDVQNFVSANMRLLDPAKNSTLSVEHRNAGNEHFRKGNDPAALAEYNKAVRFGSAGDQTLSLALANRSAVLFKQQEYSLCVQDIKLALQHNYPPHLQYKVVDRQLRCRALLGEALSVDHELNSLSKALDLADVDASKKEKFLQDTRRVLNARIAKNSQQSKATKHESTEKVNGIKVSALTETNKAPLSEKNINFDGFTTAVEMRQSDSQGRYLVAARPIKVGELIGCENALSCAPFSGVGEYRCDHCLGISITAPFCCLTCSSVMYCSLECFEVAQKTYHSWECCVEETISEVLRASRQLEAVPHYYRLGFRLLASNLSLSLEKSRELIERNRTLNTSQVPRQREANFESLFQLCSSEADSDAESDFWTCILVMFYIEVLSRKNFFNNKQQPIEWRQNIAERLYVIIKILEWNCHSILQSVMDDNPNGSSAGFRMEPIASGVFTSFAFLNHSCDPNTIKYFTGNRIHLVATRPILPGQEVTDNYGPHFSMSSKVARQAWLQKYFGFECGCPACRHNYPLDHQLSDNIATAACCRCPSGAYRQASGGGVKCDECGHSVSAEECKARVEAVRKRVLETGQMELLTGDYRRSMDEFAGFLQVLWSIGHQPLLSILTTERLYAKSLRIMNGNSRPQR